MGEGHPVHVARRGGGARVEVSVSIHPQNHHLRHDKAIRVTGKTTAGLEVMEGLYKMWLGTKLSEVISSYTDDL